MKVLQINAVYGHGSTGEIAREINLCIQQNGGRIYAAGPEKKVKAPELDGYYPIGNSIDHKAHGVFSRVLGKQGYASIGATKRFLSEVDKISPDVIHIHNLHSNYINIELLFDYIQRKKIKTVITLHDCWFLTGKCCHFAYSGCNRWRTSCGDCPRIKEELPSLFFDKTEKVLQDKKKWIGENEYVTVVGCSDWVTGIARDSILKDRVWGTIHNGIDLSIFKPSDFGMKKALGLEGKKVILGMANKWLVGENRSTFEYIVPRLNEQTVLVLVGCSSEQVSRYASANVLLVGFVRDRQKLAGYYSMADVFVNITKVDSFPTVNIEALACGTPVVTYNSGGSAETVDMRSGAVVTYGDYKNLLKQIDFILTIGKAKYTDNCVRRAKEHYNKNDRFQEYIELYEYILEKK